MDFVLLEHVKHCQSSKKTERSRGVKELSEALCSPEAVRLLREGTSGRVDWTELFRSANEALLLESQSWRTDEAKESNSAAATSKRENAKTQFVSLVGLILKKSNIPSPSIPFRVVLDSCISIFESGYLRKNFGLQFIGLLRDHVLPLRKFRSSMKHEDWEQLFRYGLAFLKTVTTNTEDPLLRTYFELMDLLIVYGCSQSHLGILVKNKLLPFLESKFDAFFKFVDSQLLLSLSLHTCSSIAKESRTGVCHFGEVTLSFVIQIYDPRQEEDSSLNQFAVDFMLLQMQCHHPNGEKEGTRAAYACDWKVWKRHVQAMYRKCVPNVIQKKATTHNFSDAFLELCTELCNQILDKTNLVFEETANNTDFNESYLGHSSKRRKLIGNSISELFEELESCKTDVTCCPLIVLVAQILKKYPALFDKEELYQLLEIVSEMQCNCKDQEMLTYILGCSQQLMDEMLKRKLCMDLWRKVWEALPRSIGLNQKEGHLLLQTFIISDFAPSNGLPTLLRMFQSSMIPPSNLSLQTLLILLTHYHLPETSKSADSSGLVSPWDLSVSSARVELINWLLACLNDCKIEKLLISKVIVLLVVNLKNKLRSINSLELTQSTSLRETSLQADYCVSAFASGLLTSEENIIASSVNQFSLDEQSVSIDSASFARLNILVKSKCEELEGKLLASQEDTTSTHSRIRNSANYLKSKVELTCEIVNFTHLLVSLSSCLIESGAFTFEAFKTSLFNDVIEKTMDFLKVLVPDALKCDTNEAITINVEKTYQVLESLRQLYHCDLVPSIHFILRSCTCKEILVPIAKIFTTFPSQDGTSDGWENPDSTTFRLLQDVKQPFTLTGATWTDVDRIHFCCLNVLALYGCSKEAKAIHKNQNSVIDKIFSYFSEKDLYDASLESTFTMMCFYLSTLLACKELKSQDHLVPAMRLLQTLCRKWNENAEASSYIMLLLKEFLKHIEADAERKWERTSWLLLFAAFKNKKFGPKFTVQFVSCFDVLLKVDPNCTWARWKNVSDLRGIIDSEIQIPTEASCKFEDAKGTVAVIEEAIMFLLNPFHEVRISAVSIVSGLFKDHHRDQRWMKSLFKRLTVVLHDLFIVKLEDMNREETIDEGSNRTAVVLHVLAAIVASSIQCYESALILIFRLLKDKNLDKGLVKKVFDLLAEYMELHNIQRLFQKPLACILENWFHWKYQFEDFPVSVLNFPTFCEFFTCFRGIILPVVWRNKNQHLLVDFLCKESKHSLPELFKASFPSLFAQHIVLLKSENISESNKLAIEHFNSFAKELGSEKIKSYFLPQIHEVLIEVTRLVWDPLHHEELLGLNLSYLEVKSPSICRDKYTEALQFLQGTADLKSDLLVYLGQEQPHAIQKVLLHLREDMAYAVTLDQKLKALHSYTVFVHAISCNLENNVFAHLADFLLSDITHTLLYLVYENKPNPGMMDVCIGCLSFLHMLFDHLIPACASAVAKSLPTIVGLVIPLAIGGNQLKEKSLEILKLLIITKRPYLKEAIGLLLPFPDASQFEDYHDVHVELKYEGQIFTLEDEMNHFLRSVGNSTPLANQNSIFDGLHFLGEKLNNNRSELLLLYQNLEHMRGFSQDCEASVMHQLIYQLISLTSSEDPKVQLEASRCLGHFGPADLTTLVLRPAEGCISLVKNMPDPMMCVMALAAHCLTDYLLDRDVNVVKITSCALLKLMACKGSNKLLSEGTNTLGVPLKKISPFIVHQKPSPKPSLVSGKKTPDALCNHEIWCPSENVDHKQWITVLTSTFFDSLSEHDVFSDLSSLCKVKTSFAEEMLPVLFYLGLSHSLDLSHQLCVCLAKFFDHHCACIISLRNSQTQTSSSGSTNIYLNKASVQCMLNVVNFVRLQKATPSGNNVFLDLNYLHVASAAQFCQAYLSSVLYLELGCNSENRDLKFDGTNIAYIDHLAEVNSDAGSMLQTLLKKAYEEIGDFDALHGCGSSILLDRNTRVSQYEYGGNWDKALLNYDMKSTNTKDVHAAAGLVTALQHSGLLNLVTTFIGSLSPDKRDQLQSAQLECMWRLGQWDVPLPSSKSDSFEWNRYSALLAYRDNNISHVPDSIMQGRLSTIKELAHSSLENCKNIYRPLAQLQALQELEDFVMSDKKDEIVSQWVHNKSLPHSEIFLLEPILAQRAKLMEIFIAKKNVSGEIQEDSNYFVEALAQHYLRTAELARKEEKVQIAEQCLYALSVLPDLSPQNKWLLSLEEAQLAWSSRKGLSDGTSLIARKILESLLKELKASEFSRASIIYPQALIVYGRWMAETHSENPQLIIEEYLEEAVELLENFPSTELIIHEQLEAHLCLAHFADLEYQRIQSYIKSESFQRKEECIKSLSADVRNVKDGKGLVKEELTAVKVTLQLTAIDRDEIKNTHEDRKKFIELAMKHYLISMKLGYGTNVPVFRMISLWLENANQVDLNELVTLNLKDTSTYKFVQLLPQLAARLGDNMSDPFCKTIYEFLMRCCVDHPHHTLPIILALANSYEDLDRKSKPQQEPRVIGASRMLSELRGSNQVKQIIEEMDKVVKSLISLAYAEVPSQRDRDRDNYYSIPKSEGVHKLRHLQQAMLPIIHLQVKADAKYPDIIGIHSFETKYKIAGGINKPKIIKCVGTDGITRTLLVKGKDDLRQDAVMQQVFGIMNSLLQTCKDTKSQRLSIRTYKIVPLSQRCGVLQWCENTAPMQTILHDVHSRYCNKDWKNPECFKKVQDARPKSDSARLRVFKEICKNFHPAFRFFFTEKFLNPAEWYGHRLAYIHSVATNSMVGYILGLGDRHISNILIDLQTAELIHIDFGIAFEQGKVLPTPETVPFRLSRDIVDGMGVSGVEGVFRRSCEKTMSVLRKNQEKILTILEVLLYDPLYAWALTPKMASKLQRQSLSSSRASIISDSSGSGNDSSVEKNKMAERALSRVREKLHGTEGGPVTSVEGQVNRLIHEARDLSNLSRLFQGWQAWF